MARDRGSLLKTVALLPLTPLAYPLGLLYGWWQRRETIVGMVRLGGRALYARSPSKRVWLSTALAGSAVVVLWHGVPWVWSHLPTLPSMPDAPPPGSALRGMPDNGAGFIGESEMISLMRVMLGKVFPITAILGIVGVAISFFLGMGMRFLPLFFGLAMAAGAGPLLLGLMR